MGLERGLDLSMPTAQLLTREMVDGAALILTMARHHRADCGRVGGEGHVFVLGAYAAARGTRPNSERSVWAAILDVYRDTCVELEAPPPEGRGALIVKEVARGSRASKVCWRVIAIRVAHSLFPSIAERRDPRPG